jgi:cation:H+ antiporter
MFFEILSFIISCFLLAILSKSLVKTLIQVAKYLNLREFVVGFFIMAFATSLPNLFVDINAALRGFPQLAFGDVVGGNLVDLTLVMAVAVLFSKKSISTKSSMVQTSAFFTGVIAILPLVLVLDGNLNRIDGVILILTFLVYSIWMFSRQGNFQKIYNNKEKSKNETNVFWLLKNVGKLLLLLGLLLASSFIVINTAQFFAKSLGASLALVGVLIVGLGNCFPETYFSIISARKNEGWMILGDLMGSVIVCATLVLGLVAIISPFTIIDFSPFLIARFFLLIAVIYYFFAIRTDKKITKKEGLLLLFLYISFLITEIFLPHFR